MVEFARCWLVLALLVITSTVNVRGLYGCSSYTNAGGEQYLANCTTLLETTAEASGNGSAIFAGRDPGRWLQANPPDTRGPLRIVNVTLKLASCAALWNLMERECTFTVSTSWPVSGLKAGRGFLYYPRLQGATATAEGLNITCPLEEWAALLAAAGGPNGRNSTGGTDLAPCGTATVSSGPELVSALEQLQAGHLRVLITLAANMSLPAQPTPQRADPAPGDDDDVPLVVLYRNVTLAAGLPGCTELNVRGRRNAFGLQAGWQLLQRQGAQQLQAPSPDGEGPNWLGRPVLVLADLVIAGYPPGPPASWPGGGLLGIFHYYVGMDRSGGAGVQLIGMRLVSTLKALHVGYFSYWYTRMLSMLPAEHTSAAWLQGYMQPTQLVPDAYGGGRAALRAVGDFALGCNSTASPVPLLAPAADDDFNLYSTSPAGLLTGATNASFTYTYALPPASFAIAGNATQLLALLQEAWSSGPRVIVLLRNITLSGRDWPQGGAALSYNVTLAGPWLGPPVQLDLAGLELVRAAGPSGGADAAGAGAGPVVLLLQRLVVAGLASPMVARWDEVAAASGALAVSEAVERWRDSCLASSAGTGDIESAAPGVLWEARNSTLVLPEGGMQLLQLYNNPAACPSGVQLAAAASAASVDPLTAVCIAQRSKSLPAPLAALLRKLLAVEGQAIFGPADVAAPASTLDIAFATFRGITLASSTATAAPDGSTNGDVAAAGAEPNCSTTALLLVLLPLATPPAQREPRGTPAAAVAGGAAAGASVGAFLLVVAAAALVLRHRRRRAMAGGAAQEASKAAAPASDAPPAGASSSAGASPSPTAPIPAGVEGGPGAAGIPCDAPLSAKAVAATWGSIPLGDSHLTFSFVSRDNASGLGAEAAGQPTLADMMLLGQNPTVPRPASTTPRPGLAPAAAAAVTAAPQPGQQPAGHSGTRNGSESPVAPPQRPELQTCLTMADSSGKLSISTRTNLRSAMEGEIEAMMRKCQARAGDLPPPSRRMQVLGRGAHGAVYLGDWRGMPAAIKVVVLVADASAARRERLAREVALTMTLDHPHIVPTYNFEVNVVRPDDGAPLDGLLATDPTKADADDDSDVAALRLKLVMQYCDGGTLRAALQEGRFSAQLPPVLRQPALPSPPALPRQPVLTHPQQQPAGAFGAPPGQSLLPAFAAVPAAAAGAISSCSSGSARAATCVSLLSGTASAEGVSTGRMSSSRAEVPDGSTPLAAEAPHHQNRPLDWPDVAAVPNLPLSLLAALDVLRGLEYLHGRGVVHGDLTENNVLLKAAQPALAQPRATGLAEQPSIRGTGSPMPAESSVAAGATLRLGPITDGGSRQGARLESPATSHGGGARHADGAASAQEGGGGAGRQRQLSGGPEDDGMPPVSTVRIALAQGSGTEAASSGTVVASTGSASKRWPHAPAPTLTSWGTSTGPVSPEDSWKPGPRGQPQQQGFSGEAAPERVAERMLRFVCKIADFGLSVQLQGGSETHLSNMAQGTPFFAAPEVVHLGRLSPAADVYSFGVLLWLLLHGVSLTQIRHLLPRTALAPIGPLLLRNASRALPPACLHLLEGTLAVEPAQRPRAAELRQALEEVLQDLAGPKLAWLLLSSDRRECLVAPTR